MLNVLFTVDTEIWCGGWHDLDRRFPDAFKRYVYGPTPSGDYALPGLFRILGQHGLKGVFMVESLFATRFGDAPLAELTGLIRDAGHEIQLHLHPEWVDESPTPLLEHKREKTPHLRAFSLHEQQVLIARAKQLLETAGAPPLSAFRAGSYALNSDTLRALSRNGISFDTSYNAGYPVGVDDVARGTLLLQPAQVEDVTVFPVTAYRDAGRDTLRHLQLTACSFAETRHVLERAEAAGYRYIVLVAHNFELLTPDKRRADRLLVRRFDRLCRYLAANDHRYRICGFNDVAPVDFGGQPEPVPGTALLTGARQAEQLLRRFA